MINKLKDLAILTIDTCHFMVDVCQFVTPNHYIFLQKNDILMIRYKGKFTITLQYDNNLSDIIRFLAGYQLLNDDKSLFIQKDNVVYLLTKTVYLRG